jgi:hypothetical protein
MTTRRWMIASLIAAILLAAGVGIDQIRRRQKEFRARAEIYRNLRQESDKLIAAYDESIRDLNHMVAIEQSSPIPDTARLEQLIKLVQATRELTQRTSTHYASLKDKYAQASRYPWRPVEPDPPEPQ